MAKLVPLPQLTRPWWGVMRQRRLATIVNGKPMSQVELARRVTAEGAAITAGGIQQMEKGRRQEQKRPMFNAIERALELPLDFLFEIHNPPDAPYVPPGEESPIETLLDVQTTGPCILIDDLTPGMEALLDTVSGYPDEVLFSLVEAAPVSPRQRRRSEAARDERQA